MARQLELGLRRLVARRTSRSSCSSSSRRSATSSRWRFPFIALISAVVGWFFVTDFISNGGNWTYVVTLFDRAPLSARRARASRSPSAFWLHLVGGLLIGVPLLYWWHSSDFRLGARSRSWPSSTSGSRTRAKRSSWAVFGTIGFFAATIHYLVGQPTSIVRGLVGGPAAVAAVSPWAPALAFGLLGFWLVLLGLARPRPPDAGAVVPAARVATRYHRRVEKPLRIGVLAVQGNFREHAAVLRRLGAEPVEVRLPEQLDGLDGLILPGGESTAIGRLMRLYGLDEAVRGFDGPIFGTCAGMIVLDRDHLGLGD